MHEKILKESKILKGVTASEGIVAGKIFLLERERVMIPRRILHEEHVPQEVLRFKDALEETKKELVEIRERVSSTEARESLFIINAHLMMLEDEMLERETMERIQNEKINAEWAFRRVLDGLAEIFNNMQDEYLRERGRDINAVGEKVLRKMVGQEEFQIKEIKEPVIVVAHDLSPDETAQMALENILGFATDVGSRTSHTAIVARSLQIPAVVGLERITREVSPGDWLILDGTTGQAVINPSPDACKEFQEKKGRLEYVNQELKKYVNLQSESADGFRVRLAANLEILEEIRYLQAYGAEGVGLYRTEYLYLDRQELPDEEVHFQNYRKLIEATSPHDATIRTLDLGGDKFAHPLHLAEEMNPAMGLRAIRFCLKSPEIFKTQLRGILRASAFGKARVMFPMVSVLEEIREAKRLLQEAAEELDRERISYDHQIEIGIMIEVPSASLMAAELAQEVDFFSIGTNDLIQYILAIDRINEHVSYLYEPLHPAVLRVIRQVVQGAHQAGIEVHMCGEMASEPLYLPVLVGLGLDELSMPAIAIPRIRKILREIKRSDAEVLVEEIFNMVSASQIRSVIEEAARTRWEEAYSLEFTNKTLPVPNFYCPYDSESEVKAGPKGLEDR
jgi:phosphotransferase system enzyme I (PtsI)